jgi:hypothetical protein
MLEKKRKYKRKVPPINPLALIGKKYGEWTVLKYSGVKRINTATYFTLLCRCSCGTIKNITAQNLISGRTTKCKRHRSRTLDPFFKFWRKLLVDAKQEGKEVDKRWMKYENFLKDVKGKQKNKILAGLITTKDIHLITAGG